MTIKEAVDSSAQRNRIGHCEDDPPSPRLIFRDKTPPIQRKRIGYFTPDFHRVGKGMLCEKRHGHRIGHQAPPPDSSPPVIPTMTPPPIRVGGCCTHTSNKYWVFLYSYDCLLFDMFFRSIVYLSSNVLL